MASNDTGPLAAARRERDEARRSAGDASAEGARLRERLTAVERERDEQRQRADEAELAVETWLATEREVLEEALDEAERERDEARTAASQRAADILAVLNDDGPSSFDAAVRCATALREARQHISRLTMECDGWHRAFDAELEGARERRALHGARPEETMADFVARLATERDAAEATLRETTIALERVRGDMRAAEERGVRAAITVAAAEFTAAGMYNARDRVRTLDAASIAARIEAPPVEAAASHRAWNDAMGIWWCDVDGCREHLRGPQRAPVEAAAERAFCGDTMTCRDCQVKSEPHRIGDTWRFGDSDREGEVRRLHDASEPVLLSLHVSGPTSLTVMARRTLEELRAEGWRRVRCAPAGGDAVRVGEGVGVVARLPEAPLQGVRVDGPGDRMTIAEAGELEMAVQEET